MSTSQKLKPLYTCLFCSLALGVPDGSYDKILASPAPDEDSNSNKIMKKRKHTSTVG